jgi:oligopeptide transport system substrate-binding protein
MHILLRSLFLLIAVFFGTSCSKKQSVEGVNTLRVGNGGEPSTLDPQLIIGLPEMHIALALFEGLTSLDPKTLEVRPGVAESWGISSDGYVYTFHLRENAKWSNGSPLTASDFVRSYKRILTPSFGAPMANMLYLIDGAEDFHKGKIDDFSYVGVDAIDDHTLQIRLKEPTVYFLNLAAHCSYYPVPCAIIEKCGPLDSPANPWTRSNNIVSNGPFVLSEWKIGDKLCVTRNSNYWNGAKLDAIEFYPISDPITEERSFLSGQLHITNTVPLSKISRYQKDYSKLLQECPSLSTSMYLFNTTKLPLNDPRVRQALSLALNREYLAKKVLGGGEISAYTLVPPGIPGYVNDYRLAEDLARAKVLLAEAGYPGGKGFPVLELIYNTSADRRRLAEAIQEMWHKHLGIEIRLVNQEWKVFLESRRQGQFDICRFDWVGDYIDATTFLDLMKSNSPMNVLKWSHPVYDELMNAAARTLDPQKRQQILMEAEAILLDQVPCLPLVFPTSKALVSQRVIGLYPNALDLHPWANVELLPE